LGKLLFLPQNLFIMHRFLFTIVLLLFTFNSVAQTEKIPINLSIFNESTSIPFTRFFTTPIHPGIQVGTELNYHATDRNRLFQTLNLSYFYHGHLNQGIALHTELGYERRLPNGLSFSGLLGVGYMRTYAVSEEFVFENDQYIQKADTGNSRFFPSLSVDTGYYLKKQEKDSPRIFIRYQAWAEYPYSPDFIPIMSHVNLHVGVKFFIKRNTTETHE
jgi:hypothetical protein